MGGSGSGCCGVTGMGTGTGMGMDMGVGMDTSMGIGMGMVMGASMGMGMGVDTSTDIDFFVLSSVISVHPVHHFFQPKRRRLSTFLSTTDFRNIVMHG